MKGTFAELHLRTDVQPRRRATSSDNGSRAHRQHVQVLTSLDKSACAGLKQHILVDGAGGRHTGTTILRCPRGHSERPQRPGDNPDSNRWHRRGGTAPRFDHEHRTVAHSRRSVVRNAFQEASGRSSRQRNQGIQHSTLNTQLGEEGN